MTAAAEAPAGPIIQDPRTLKSMREALGLTQGELARTLGLYPGTLSRWELGKQPVANPEMLAHAIFGVVARDIIDAAQWSREAEGFQVSQALVDALAKLRHLAEIGGLSNGSPPAALDPV